MSNIVTIDIGGTFTDLTLYKGSTKELIIHKLLTTTHQPREAVLQGVQELTEKGGIGTKDISRIIHGTTLITNALIERKGDLTGFIGTEGFRDVIEVGNESRYNPFDLGIERPAPIVERWARRTVKERIATDGSVIIELDEKSLREEIQFLQDSGIKTIAVGLYNSYRNGVHEQRIKEIIEEEYPGLMVSISSEIAPEIREYERFSTSAANAYVKPIAVNYFSELDEALRGIGIVCPVFLVISDGGLTTLDTGREQPVQITESGPAAGVIMSTDLSKKINKSHILSFDMGGTTAKVALVKEGTPERSHEFEVSRVHRFQKGSGFPIRIPTIELVEIGAGGGSIAWKDSLGLLRVGPQSAGSDPGPACYGRGGKQPTVTDADLVLGYLNPDYFLGGRRSIDKGAAIEALSRLGDELGMTHLEVAAGIHAIVNNNMSSAARIHMAEKGGDPRIHSMVAFGGAGPVHAYGIAHQLNVPEVIYPVGAGVASAIGMLVSEPTREWTRSYFTELSQLSWEEAEGIVNELSEKAKEFMQEMNEQDYFITVSVDLRYKGQGYELTVECPELMFKEQNIQLLEGAFEEVYKQRFGRAIEGVAIEILTWRLRVTAPKPDKKFELKVFRTKEHKKEKREVYFHQINGLVMTEVYDRYSLQPGETIQGPAIIEETESTIVAGPDTTIHVDEQFNIYVRINKNS